VRRPAGWLWRRIAGPPPELTEADIVPPEAEPICPRCILPHHPLLAVCPECGEVVSRWAPLMSPAYIFIWGRAMWRIMGQSRLSGLICVGLVVSGVGYLVQAALIWLGFIRPPSWGEQQWWERLELSELVSVPICLAVAFRMWEKATRAWGSWREAEEPEEEAGG
jgi:hypothetical protein